MGLSKYVIWMMVFALLIMFSGCKPAIEDAEGRMIVVATTGMIGDMAEKLLANQAKVVTLMGPGVDPHLYKATHGDLEKLQAADVILYNGLHLEGKMADVLEKYSKHKPTIAVAELVPEKHLRKTGGETHDPHVWFDVELWRKITAATGKKLADVIPEMADEIRKNTAAYAAELDNLHQWVKAKILEIPPSQRVLITAHDAFGYFGDAYGIEVKGLQGISTLSEYGLRDVRSLVDLVTGRNIKAVFVESSVSDKSIESVIAGARDLGHEVKKGGTLFSDAMGEKGTAEGTYIGMVKYNVNTIVEALK